MKKIVILILSLFLWTGVSAQGIPEALYTAPLKYRLCFEDKSYVITTVYNLESKYYTLNVAPTYNFLFQYYYEIPYEGTIYEKAVEYVAYSKILKYNTYYAAILTPYIYNALYADATYELCYDKDDTKIVTEMAEAEKVMQNVTEGPDFLKTTHKLAEGETKEFTNEYLKYFYVADTGGLNVEIVDNKITFSGDVGSYQAVLKRYNNGYTEKARLFTNGTDYLMKAGTFPDVSYYLNVQIGIHRVVINALDPSGNVKPDVCYEVKQESKTLGSYCTDEIGSLALSLEQGTYLLEREGEKITLEVTGDLTFNDVIEEKKAPAPEIPKEDREDSLEPEEEPDFKPEYEEVINQIGDKDEVQVEIIPEDTYSDV